MGSSDRSVSFSLTWAVVVLAVGALLGVAGAAIMLNRKAKAQAEDPDAPLFI